MSKESPSTLHKMYVIVFSKIISRRINTEKPYNIIKLEIQDVYGVLILILLKIIYHCLEKVILHLKDTIYPYLNIISWFGIELVTLQWGHNFKVISSNCYYL